MTVTDSSLRRSLWTDVRTIIFNNKGSFGASKIPSVYAKLPDTSPAFPAIVIRPVNTSKDEWTIGTRSVSTKILPIIIDIFAKKNEDIDLISDAIDVYMTSNAISGVFVVGWEESTGEVFPTDAKIKLKTITITFKRR